MADKRVKDLTENTSLSANQYLMTDDTTATRKVTLTTLATWILNTFTLTIAGTTRTVVAAVNALNSSISSLSSSVSSLGTRTTNLETKTNTLQSDVDEIKGRGAGSESSVLTIIKGGSTSGGAQSHTLAAVKAARNNGYRAVLVLFWFSSDDIPVVWSTGNYKANTISQTTYADLKNLGITSFEEVVAYCKAAGLTLYAQCSTTIRVAQASAVVNVVERYNMLSKVAFHLNYESAIQFIADCSDRVNLRLYNPSQEYLERYETGKNTIGAWYSTGAKNQGINASASIPLAQTGRIVGGTDYNTAEVATLNMPIDSSRGAVEFLVQSDSVPKAEDILAQ